jgi:uncharacterized protein involved in response to NO
MKKILFWPYQLYEWLILMPLVAAPATIVAYVSLVLAIAVRVFGPALLPLSYTTILLAAGSLWVLTFLLFAIVYAPILLGPRVDGKSG